MSGIMDVAPESIPQRTDWNDPTIVAVGGGGDAIDEGLGGTPAGAAAVTRARTQIGVAETGNNCGVPHNRYVKWIAGAGTPCVPWCAYFVGWAFDTSTIGNHDHKAPWGTSGYVPWIYDWASRHGKLVAVPSHGDVFFLNPTSSGQSHIGLVAGANPARHLIYTCERNWGGRVLGQNRDYRAGDIRFARL